MKPAKKLYAMVLAVLMILSVGAVAGFADDSAQEGTEGAKAAILPYTNDFSGENALDGWAKDRWDPAKFEVTEDDKLLIAVDGTGAKNVREDQSDFRNTQGKNFMIQSDAIRWEVSAKIGITQEMLESDTAVRSDLWASTIDVSTKENSGYPILGFKRGAHNADNNDPADVGVVNGTGEDEEKVEFTNVWRFWDNTKPEFWSVSDKEVTAGEHTLKMEGVGSAVTYYVDGEVIGKTALSGNSNLSAIMIQAYNFGLDAEYTGYSVLWDDVSVVELPEETGSIAYIETNGEKEYYLTVQDAIDAAAPGATVTVMALEDQEPAERLSINKAITLKGEEGAKVHSLVVSAAENIDGLTVDGLIFTAASNVLSLDSTLSTIYLGSTTGTLKNVTIKNCIFENPKKDVSETVQADATSAITSGPIENLVIEDCTIDGYSMSAYHNPGAKSITYRQNTFKNILSGIGFMGTDGITVTGNTFENANGVRLEKGWDAAGTLCKTVKINDNTFTSVSSDGAYGQYAVRVAKEEGGEMVAGYEGTVDLSENFWGEGNNPEDVVAGYDEENVDVYPYYTDAEQEIVVNAKVKSVNINQKSIDLYVGDSYTLKATVTPEDASGNTVIWSSSNESVATVSSEGVVRAKKVGSITITAKSADESDTCKVNVVRQYSIGGSGSGSGGSGNNSGSGILIPDNNNNNNSNQGSANAFTDVNENDWFYASVTDAVAKGLFTGITENTFEPNGQMTRAMLVTVLWRMENSPVTAQSSFTDVTAGQWYAQAVSWAANNGIVTGVEEGIFAPDQAVTREQLATIVKRFADYKGTNLGETTAEVAFADSDLIADYAKESVQTMQKAGILSGREDGTFDPQGTATRAECAKILTMLLNR